MWRIFIDYELFKKIYGEDEGNIDFGFILFMNLFYLMGGQKKSEFRNLDRIMVGLLVI